MRYLGVIESNFERIQVATAPIACGIETLIRKDGNIQVRFSLQQHLPLVVCIN